MYVRKVIKIIIFLESFNFLSKNFNPKIYINIDK